MIGTLNFNNGIVESGSNTNSNYIKFSDGTMVCYNQISTTSSLTAYYSTLTRTNDIGVTFPKTFTNIPYIAITPIGNQTIGCYISTGNPATTTGFATMLFKGNAATATTCIFNYIAIGRWK